MDKRIKLKKQFPKVNNFRKCLLKVGDEVQLITGKNKGQTGKIIDFDRKRGLIKVQGMKIMTHFVKKDQQREGGIIKAEGFFDLSNVMFCENGTITRLGRNESGKRVSKKTQQEI